MNQSRNKQVILRLSESELDLLHEKIKQSGMKQQKYLLQAALNAPIINMGAIRELLPELKKQGINLNQIAKALNQRGYVDYHSSLRKALEAQTETWQLLKQFLHTLP
ncbi:plasmid mobilization protein [Intestinibacillus sp. Marseille-P6563]|uniref:plasmid mobilization protein n=1 Tax=Intestinibacillus sp. Marseille-P6563 TaxID=2364792 RepID=UPI000F0485EB|nr:plasmid mobilization relaxosome protein MobC [Intestinibacillus sp. Marseille-P6563]